MPWIMNFGGEEIGALTDRMYEDFKADLMASALDHRATMFRLEFPDGARELLWSPGVPVIFHQVDVR